MSAQWYDPMTSSPEGVLLTEVRDLFKAVKNKKKADLDKDGELSGYEKKRAKAIEGSMAREGYKSDRGEKPAPKLPSPKGKKLFGKSSDASDNCPQCGANPHEECGMPGRSGEHQAINCTLNPIAFDSRMDDLREPKSIMEHLDENHGNMRLPSKVHGILLRDEGARASIRQQVSQKMNELYAFVQSNFDPGLDGSGGDMFGRTDELESIEEALTNFFHDYLEYEMRTSGGTLEKYEKEPSSMNSVPRFQNVDGGIPVIARGFTTNQRIPHTEDGIKKKIVSEKANIPAYAQQGYTVKSSSLHMHLTDGGNSGTPPNIARIEERLSSLTKGASRNNQGVIGEIEGLIKQIKNISKAEDHYCDVCDNILAKKTTAWRRKGMCGTEGCEGNEDHPLFG